MKSIVELIGDKRDGVEHSEEEVRHLVSAYVTGEMPDYQMSAWLMAAFIRGLSSAETAYLTKAMAESGRMIDLSSVPGTILDKHSTGGVGDKTTLVLAPLVASCGVPVAKMSGRGLGHTGGTLDKLESIPGFSVSLAEDALLAQLLDIGVVVTAQSADVDPADKKMYALRDVTGTVQSIPLIVGSIISKKVAGGANAIVLDVKVGSGAFMKTEAEARALAHELQRVGELLGRKVVCVMTDMSQPLGMAVGNSVEVCEAIRTLKGDGPADLTELCLALGAKMLVLGGVADDEVDGRSMLLDSIASGAAIERFSAWIAAQGGDARVADDSELLPLAQYVTIVDAPRSGYVTGFDAEGVGRSAMLLGAGRETKESQIDLGAGLVLQAKIGDAVQAGRPIATLYASDEMLFEAAREKLLASVMIGDEEPELPVLFHEV